MTLRVKSIGKRNVEGTKMERTKVERAYYIDDALFVKLVKEQIINVKSMHCCKKCIQFNMPSKI